jgi:multidrug efflux pump subunit AcrA (membrane-fusion protein)
MARVFQSLLIFLAGVTVTIAVLRGSDIWQPSKLTSSLPATADSGQPPSSSSLSRGDSVATDSAATDSAATDSAATDSAATDSAATDSAATDPAALDSEAADSAAADSAAADSAAADSEAVDSAVRNPTTNKHQSAKSTALRTPTPISQLTAAAASPSLANLTWPLVLTGITEPGYGRFAKLPLATNQPVAFVDVKPGDTVEKGWQVFSHWESPDRLQAIKNDVERTKKQRKIAQTRLAAAEQSLARLEKLTGKVTPQELQDAQTLVAIRRGESEAAELSVQEADNRFTALDFEFKQAFVTSPIDGIVVSVNVVQGERRQASESFRGVTILDPTVLNCRCLVTPRHAQWLRQPRETAPLMTIFDQEQSWPAKLVHVGVMAEGATGLVPVIFEVPNPDRNLLCGIPVQVRLELPGPASTTPVAPPVTANP